MYKCTKIGRLVRRKVDLRTERSGAMNINEQVPASLWGEGRKESLALLVKGEHGALNQGRGSSPLTSYRAARVGPTLFSVSQVHLSSGNKGKGPLTYWHRSFTT